MSVSEQRASALRQFLGFDREADFGRLRSVVSVLPFEEGLVRGQVWVVSVCLASPESLLQLGRLPAEKVLALVQLLRV